MFDLEFIAAHYNYWIFIVLMMIGLYTVISRGNLIKKIVGLNIFQTSVFIYYISMGKITGGTAPILLGGEGHGGTEEEAGDALHAAETMSAGAAHGGVHAAPSTLGEGLSANDLSAAVSGGLPIAQAGGQALHAAPAANPALSAPPEAPISVPPAPHFDVAPPAEAAHHAAAGVDQALGALHKTAEVIYTNPLPHVLILTAIVVGVATSAVGLALAVRIREAYGTIEEDELEAADDIAEFGRPMGGEAGAR